MCVCVCVCVCVCHGNTSYNGVISDSFVILIRINILNLRRYRMFA